MKNKEAGLSTDLLAIMIALGIAINLKLQIPHAPVESHDHTISFAL